MSKLAANTPSDDIISKPSPMTTLAAARQCAAHAPNGQSSDSWLAIIH